MVVRSLYFGGDAFFEREVACAARRHDAQYWQPRQVLILRVDDVMNDSREVMSHVQYHESITILIFNSIAFAQYLRDRGGDFDLQKT